MNEIFQDLPRHVAESYRDRWAEELHEICQRKKDLGQDDAEGKLAMAFAYEVTTRLKNMAENYLNSII